MAQMAYFFLCSLDLLFPALGPTQNYEPSILKTRMVFQATRTQRGLPGLVLFYLFKE